MEIAEFESYEAQVESWWHRSRCLLLDRKTRRFFVSTISEVRNWLLLQGALFANGNAQWRLRRRLSATSAVEELFQWLDSQPIPTISGQYLKAWEARFSAKRAIAGCVAAAFRLGFKGNEVREMMFDAFGHRDP